MFRTFAYGFAVAFCAAMLSKSSFAGEPLKVEQFTLSNGMEVVVIPNHSVPAVSHMLWFKIGSADERQGVSGLAHYLEHMMFKGTKTLKVGEYSQIMAKHGGDHNAFTNLDYTGYYVNIAKQHLPLVMKTEADRMVNLSVDDAEFLKEREVIMEERSMRTDNQPGAVLDEQMRASLYTNHHYGIPVIGWRQEMEALSKAQVFDMYHRYYHPNNAILLLIGDVTAEEIKPLVESTYGKLSAGELMERHWADEPKPVAARRVILKDEKVLQPAFERYYLAPSFVYGEKEHAMPLVLLSQVLGGSQTSRLYQKLVVEQKIASQASAEYNGLSRGPAEFSISAVPAEGISLEKLEAAIDAVIQDTLQTGVTEEELRRAKNQAKAEVIYARDGLESLGIIMGNLLVIGLGVDFFNQWPNAIEAVSADQIKNSGVWLLQPERSVTGWLEKKESPTPPASELQKKELEHAQ